MQWRPATGTLPKFAALVCHPHPLYGGTLHNKVVYQAAKALDLLGAAVLRFNFRGAGMSVGNHDKGLGEKEDVQTAVNYLSQEFPGVPLLLAGFSFGSWVGLQVGCIDARVLELIGIGAPVNNSDFSFLNACPKPKLFVHGELDEFGDVRKVRELVANLPASNELVVVPGVDHFFAGNIEELGNAITEWVSVRHPEWINPQ